MKFRFNVLFALSFLLSGSAHAAVIDRFHPDYQVASDQVFKDALSGDVVISSAIASCVAAIIASGIERCGDHSFFPIPTLIMKELAKEDSNSDDFRNIKNIVAMISVAAKAGHAGALALVSYCTAIASTGDESAAAVVAAFANKGIIVDADLNALGSAGVAYNNAVIDVAYSYVYKAAAGNVAAIFDVSEFASQVADFALQVAQQRAKCLGRDKENAEAIATIAQAAQAGNEKAQAVIAHFTALANAGDANAAAVVTAFATAHEKMHVAAVAVE